MKRKPRTTISLNKTEADIILHAVNILPTYPGKPFLGDKLKKAREKIIKKLREK